MSFFIDEGLHMFRHPIGHRYATPPARVPQYLTYDHEHLIWRTFICDALRDILYSQRNQLTIQERNHILAVALEDETSNLRGNPRSLARDTLSRLNRNPEDAARAGQVITNVQEELRVYELNDAYICASTRFIPWVNEHFGTVQDANIRICLNRGCVGISNQLVGLDLTAQVAGLTIR